VVSTVASQLQGPGFNSSLASLSVWSLHVLPISAWVSSGCFVFLPLLKDMQVKWIVHVKLPFSVTGTRMA